MLSDSMFCQQFLHRAAKEPVAALRLFRSSLHFFSSQGGTEVFSLEAVRLGRDEHTQKVCRADQKGWLSQVIERKKLRSILEWIIRNRKEGGSKLEGSKDHDPTGWQMGSSQMVTHLSWLSVVWQPRLMGVPTFLLAAGPSSDQIDQETLSVVM